MNRDTRPAPGVGPAPAGWRKSSRSAANANCVEINRTHPDLVHIRDSKGRASGPIITVTHLQWASFIDQLTTTP